MRAQIGLYGGLAVGGAALWMATGDAPSTTPPVSSPQGIASFKSPGPEALREPDEDDHAFEFRVPSGEPTSLACDEAAHIVAQVRATLAYEPDPIVPRAFADATADWIDPHGVWSMAPDAPAGPELAAAAADLLAEIESPRGDCPAARHVGATLAAWADKLRVEFDRTRAVPDTMDPVKAATDPVFTGVTAQRPAMELAAELGRRVSAFELGFGPTVRPYADAARERFFPALDAEGWGRVVLAGAVRAYVELVDPHGGWAPFEEEASVYEIDLAARPPARLWASAAPTAVGVRVAEPFGAPLQAGDVVLSVAGVATAGMSGEQLDQLGYVAADARVRSTAIVLRPAETTPRALDLAMAEPPPASHGGPDPGLETERVAFGDTDVLLLAIHDVRDDLGEVLAHAIGRERANGGHPLGGVVLDLRGNGGGSTDGAIAALGLFLPGARLFPMKRRDGTLETDTAPEPPHADRWTGPVASLVDGATASAAEMIAGALAVYRRGPSVGTPTYGKGCAQEYVDDDAHAGVLRLTTLLFALPDGTPVQRMGLTPTIYVPFASPGAAGAGASSEREAMLPHSPPTWRGPDVRRPDVPPVVAWPAHAGIVGPCKDLDVCRALRALGGPPRRITAAKAK